MRFPRRPVAASVLLFGLLALAVVPPCAAQIPRGGNGNSGDTRRDPQAYGRRTDAFRRLLFELRFQPLPSFAELQDKPEQSLFIMLGDPRCLSGNYFPEELRDFVERGGAVLIATDKKTEGEAGTRLKELASVTVTGETLVQRWPLKPDIPLPSRYDNSEYCPFVEPIDAWTAAEGPLDFLAALPTLLGPDGRPDLFRRDPQPGSSRLQVATNAPSYLKEAERLPRGNYRLARLPGSCQDEKKLDVPIQQEDGTISREFVDKKGPLFAVGGTVGKGRFLVLADHSIFINRMMLPRDIGNLEFAANCLHWLRGGVSSPMEALRAVNNPDAVKQLAGQRKYVLFWDDGHVHNNFEVPLKKVSLPSSLGSEPAIVAAIDKTLAKLEDEDYFNRQLFESMDDLAGGRRRVYRYSLYLLTFAAFLFLGYRFLWRTRHRPEYAVSSLADAVSKHEPKASLLDQRRRALLRLGNVWEMGHRLARDCFESAGVAVTGASPPRVVMAHGNWRQRWRVRRRVARLWRLARRDAPVPLSPAALQHRLRELEELKTALVDGTIRLT